MLCLVTSNDDVEETTHTHNKAKMNQAKKKKKNKKMSPVFESM